MRLGEIELLYLGNREVVALWGGNRLLPDNLIECESGTLTAAEYVAMYAVRFGKVNAAVSLFCQSSSIDPGAIEYCETIPVH